MFLNTHMVRKSTRTKHIIFGPSYLWHTNQKLLDAPWVICILARLSAQGPWGCFWLTSRERHPSNRTTGITMTLPQNWQKRMYLWQDVLWYSSSWCHLFDSLDLMYHNKQIFQNPEIQHESSILQVLSSCLCTFRRTNQHQSNSCCVFLCS